MSLLLYLKPHIAYMIPAPSGCDRKDARMEYEMAQKRKKKQQKEEEDKHLIDEIIKRLLEEDD